MDKSKAMGTTIAQHFKLSKEDSSKTVGEEEYMDGIPLCHAVSVVYRHMTNLGKKH